MTAPTATKRIPRSPDVIRRMCIACLWRDGRQGRRRQARYRHFFALFENFSAYVDMFLLQDLVPDDCAAVTFVMPFDDFRTPSVPGGRRHVQEVPTSKHRVHRSSKPSDRPTHGRSTLTQASRPHITRLSPSTCRNHPSSWFQLAKMRLAMLDGITRHKAGVIATLPPNAFHYDWICGPEF